MRYVLCARYARSSGICVQLQRTAWRRHLPACLPVRAACACLLPLVCLCRWVHRCCATRLRVQLPLYCYAGLPTLPCFLHGSRFYSSVDRSAAPLRLLTGSLVRHICSTYRTFGFIPVMEMHCCMEAVFGLGFPLPVTFYPVSFSLTRFVRLPVLVLRFWFGSAVYSTLL